MLAHPSASVGTRRQQRWWSGLLLWGLTLAAMSAAHAQTTLAIEIVTPANGEVIHAHDSVDIDLTSEVWGTYSNYVLSVEYFVDDVSVGFGDGTPARRFVWRGVTPGTYMIRAHARAGIPLAPPGFTADSPPVQIDVRAPQIRPVLAPDAPPLQFTPGTEVAIPVIALDEFDHPMPGVVLSWNVTTVDKARPKANCADTDSPDHDQSTTDANGRALLRFVPGCTSSNRQLVVRSGNAAAPLQLTLHGPDDRAGAIRLASGESVLVLPPATSTPITYAVVDTQDLPIAGATVDLSLAPADAGSIEPSIRVGDDGSATAHLKLTEAGTAAVLTACVRGNTGVCVHVPVRNTHGAIAVPAAAILTPIVQQALDAPGTQFDNINQHLRSQRSGGAGRFSNDVTVSTDKGSVGGDGANEGGASPSRVSVFAAGNIDLGQRDGSRDGFDATTRGLTVGVDVRVKPSLVLGAALGGLRAHTDAAAGVRLHASGLSGSLYAQYLPTERAYVSAALNIGGEDFDMRRPACGKQLTASTDSSHRALSLEAGYSLASRAIRFTPYLRYQYVQADLDPLLEHGDCIDALSISATSLRRSTLAGGASIDRAFSTRSGVWIPALAVEYTSQAQHHDAIFARLLAAGPTVPVQLAKVDRHFGIARFSLSWMTSVQAHPLSAFLGLDTDIGRSDYDSRTFMLGLRIPF
ncbi:MAG: autotransporter domain-containing protein [Xanthomonadales bacterium]|nr:autotransporter domain-containing protein [Xanthomonadales bacterium]MDL1868997.1 autotransporter domain-containing protein [Gammaproteobacteria bacterium PRO6]